MLWWKIKVIFRNICKRPKLFLLHTLSRLIKLIQPSRYTVYMEVLGIVIHHQFLSYGCLLILSTQDKYREEKNARGVYLIYLHWSYFRSSHTSVELAGDSWSDKTFIGTLGYQKLTNNSLAELAIASLILSLSKINESESKWACSERKTAASSLDLFIRQLTLPAVCS